MLTIVIPTYNEKDNLQQLILQINDSLGSGYDYEILFVDDSTDDSPGLLEELSASNADSKIRYIHRSGERGLASAVVCGFDKARGDILAVMDADLQHPPSLLPRMLALIEGGADIVLPSRYISGGGREGLSSLRALASKAALLSGKIFLKSMRKISDPMSGFFMMRRDVIAGVSLKPIGWKILMEVLVLGNYRHVVELPYSFKKRSAGESKLSAFVSMQYFAHILSLIARSESDRRFYLFAMIGLSGVLVDMLAFTLITSFWSPSNNAAASLSACIPIITNYLLNRNLTWRSSRAKKPYAEFARYALVCILGLGIKNVFVFLLTLAGVLPILCNLVGIAGSTASNYILNGRWVFSTAEEKVTYTVLTDAS